VQDGAGRDVEIARSLVVLHLSTTEDETLLWRGDTRLLLYFLFDPSNLVHGIDIKLDLFACEGLYFDEHCVDTSMVFVVGGSSSKASRSKFSLTRCYLW